MNTSAATAQVNQGVIQNPVHIQWIVNLIIATVLLLLPYEQMTFQYNTKIVDYALVFTILFSSFCIAFINKIIHLPLIWPIFLILIATLISTVAGISNPDSFIAVLKDVYIFVWFISLTNLLNNQSFSNVNTLMKIWSMIALAEATAAILGMLSIGPKMFYTSPDLGVVLSIGRFNRAIGTYVNPNALGVYLSVSLFIILASNWSSFIKALMTATLLVSIVATGSLGALVSTVATLFLLFGLNEYLKTKKIPKFWSFILAVGLVVFLVLVILLLLTPFEDPSIISPNRPDLYNLTLGRFSRSVSTRLPLIQLSIQDFFRYPMGTGPETHLRSELHNDYLAYLIERGPFGLLGWLGVVGLSITRTLRMAIKIKINQNRLQLLTIGMGFLACALNSFTHEIAHFRQVWVFLAFLTAITYHYSKSIENGT